MKKTKKLLAFLLAMVMILAMGMTAMAANVVPTTDDQGNNKFTGPASIIVDLYDYTEAEIKNGAKAENTYYIYKVFDATTDTSGAISYKLVNGKETAPQGFTVDNAGNVSFDGEDLTSEHIAAVASYVNTTDLVATVTTTEKDTDFEVSGLPYGYYYITTTTGTVVTIDSTKPTASVIDKNTAPSVEKKITDANLIINDGKDAFQEIGETVEYTATITVGQGAKGYVFHDIMGTGLKFNNDVKVKIGNEEITNTDDSIKYKVEKDEDDTFTVKFEDSYIQTLDVGTQIIITYSAKVEGDASSYNNNDAYVSYGDSNSVNKTPISMTDIYNKLIRVIKIDSGKNPLVGAGFSLKKTVNGETVYYKYNEETKDVEWVDSVEDADKFVSKGNYGFTDYFKGLVPGTYYLEETQVPAGYNKAEDVEVVLDDSTEHASVYKEVTIENNKGIELPSTGGIGTTMFYVIGGALVLVTVVLLVTRKRMSVEK